MGTGTYHTVKGDRVGVILGISDGVIYLLGYGTFEGYEVPPPGERGGGLRDVFHREGRLTPKIVLDNGKVVWGCECWWQDETTIKAMVEIALSEGKNGIVEVDIDDVRFGKTPGKPLKGSPR